MSDNKNIPLVDRGWSQMSSVLDVEMPVKKKKRRAIVWFFLSGAAAALVFFLFYSNGQSMVQPELKTPNMAESIIFEDLSQNVDIVQVAQNNVDNEYPQKENIQLTIDHGQKKNDLVQNPNSTLIQKTIIKHPATQSNLSSYNNDLGTKANEIINEELLVEPENQINNVDRPSSKISIIDSAKEAEIEEAISGGNPKANILIETNANLHERSTSEKNTQRNKVEFLSKLLLNSTSYLQMGNNRLNFPSMIDRFVIPDANENKNLSNHNYVFAGGIYDRIPSGLGYQLGLGRSASIGGFDLFAELSYSNVSYNNQEGESEMVSFNLDEHSSGSDFSTVKIEEILDLKNGINNSRLANNTLITHLDYISLRLGVEKSIYKSFYLNGGISYARFLSIKNKGLSFSSNLGELNNDLQGFNVSNTDLYDNEEFSKYEISASLGLGYNLSSRISLSGKFRYGITNLYNNNNKGQGGADADLPMIESNLQGGSVYTLNRSGIEMNLKYNF